MASDGENRPRSASNSDVDSETEKDLSNSSNSDSRSCERLNNQSSQNRPQGQAIQPQQHASANPMIERTLSFSIENILKPDFGRKAGAESSKVSNKNNSGKKTLNVHPDNRLTCSPGSEDEAAAKRKNMLWPAWVYCTRYSDRPSSVCSSAKSGSGGLNGGIVTGPRSRRMKKKEKKPEEKRPRTAFTNEQLQRLKKEFQENRYLTEKRRQDLANDLKLNESQIKIWFQNKRAKIKKANGQRNGLALHLMAQGLYNHTTMGNGVDEDDEEQQEK